MKVSADRQVYLYVSDDRFAWILGISMMSLLEHNPGAQIYVLSQGISRENQDRLQQVVGNGGGELHIVEIPERYLNDELRNRRWTSIVFVRLFMADFLPESVRRAVYLDCDTMVVGSLAPMWETDMGDAVCCGVRDCISSAYRRNIGLDAEEPYVNAGVLMFDMDKLRAFPVKEKMNAFLNAYHQRMSYGDQDTVNGIYKGQIKCLPMAYNVMSIAFRWSYQELMRFRRPSGFYSEEEYLEGIRNPAIIHLTGHFWNTRPWFLDSDHPYAHKFLEYKAASPWKEMELMQKNREGTKERIISLSMKLPKGLFLSIFGLVHAECYPRYKLLRWHLTGRGQNGRFF